MTGGAFTTDFDESFAIGTAGGLNLSDLYARVGELLHVAPTDPAVVGACDAAVLYVATVENLAGPDSVPGDPLTFQGLVGFSRALYLDQLAARGSSVVVADQTVDTVFTPEDIYRHWRHYFSPLASAWGIA